jgi:hypothetical protein
VRGSERERIAKEETVVAVAAAAAAAAVSSISRALGCVGERYGAGDRRGRWAM